MVGEVEVEMTTGSDPYGVMAPHFDSWQRCLGGDFSKLMLPRIDAILARCECHPRSLLDLGCGTGTLLGLFGARGLRAVGVDQSAQMLREARRKLGRDALLARARMEAIPIRGSFDLVTCMYDTVNHLRDAEALVATFKEVRRLLAPGGLFVFDSNNLHCYRVLWTARNVVEMPGVRVVVNTTFDEATCVGTAQVVVTQNGAAAEHGLRERFFLGDEIVRGFASARLAVVYRSEINPFTPGDTTPIKTLWAATPV